MMFLLQTAAALVVVWLLSAVYAIWLLSNAPTWEDDYND